MANDPVGPDLRKLFAAPVDAALQERGLNPCARVVWNPVGVLSLLPLRRRAPKSLIPKVGSMPEQVTNLGRHVVIAEVDRGRDFGVATELPFVVTVARAWNRRCGL